MKPSRVNPGGQPAGSDRRAPAANHVVHFYDEQEALIQSAAAFLAGGLLRGAPALVLIAPPKVQAMQRKLGEMGVDVERATAARQLVLLDSSVTVELLLVDGMPDEQRFREVIGKQVTGMMDIWRPFQLHGFGDMVDLLYTRGDADAAIELERLWDDLAHREGFSLYCAYDATQFSHDRHRAAFHAICRHHNMIMPMQRGSSPLAEAGSSYEEIPAS